MNEISEILANIGNQYGVFAELAIVGIIEIGIIKILKLIIKKIKDNTIGL